MLRIITSIVLLASCAVLSAESTSEEIERFGREATRMLSEAKMPADVAVTLLSPRLKGACLESPHRRLLILDNGYEENIKTLKHELDHMRRFLDGQTQWKEEKLK